MGRTESRRFPVWEVFILLIILLFVAVVATIAIPLFHLSGRASNDRSVQSSLKTLACAELDFRANDRDGDRVQNFWTGDVAGLYCIRAGPSPPGPPNKLIDLETAAADIHCCPGYSPGIGTITTQGPKRGYWFQALRRDLELGESYRQEGGTGGSVSGNYFHNEKFGFVMYPSSFPSPAKDAFIVNESQTLFKRPLTKHVQPVLGQDLGDSAFCDWPTEATLRSSWSKLD